MIFGACAGLCYNALWYFPVLMVIGGFTTWIWDSWLNQKVGKLQSKLRRRRQQNKEGAAEQNAPPPEPVSTAEEPERAGPSTGLSRRNPAANSKDNISVIREQSGNTSIQQLTRESDERTEQATQVADTSTHAISVKVGVGLIVAFFGMCTPYYVKGNFLLTCL